ncbi:MAG TPA: FAD-dependent oxidoreductase [Phenylobacterium sp.]|nr:FAD-dependent oxidoreductase [Phenylobacterium sp.]
MDRQEGGEHPVLILGGGVSGLVAADIIAASGQAVVILEPYDRLGGNQRSLNIGAYTFDIGSFVFFAGSPFFQRFPGAQAVCQPARISVDRVTPQGRISKYPFSIANDLLRRGPIEVARTFLSLGYGRFKHGAPLSAGSFARYHLGDRLFVQSGLEAYIHRLCGIPADDVDYKFAEKRMNWIAQTVSFGPLFNRVIKAGREPAAATPQVLIRPRQGFERLFDQVAEQLRAAGVQIHLDNQLEQIETLEDGFRVTTSKGAFVASRVISSLPLTMTAQACGIEASGHIRSLPLLSLFVAFDGDLGFESEVLYNFSVAGSWKRLTMHSRTYGQVDGRHYLSVEVPLAAGPSDAAQEFASFLAFMEGHGLLRGQAELLGHELTDFAYPTYARGSIDASEALIERIEQTGVEMLGRQGRFDYIPTASKATQLVAEQLSASSSTGVRRPH